MSRSSRPDRRVNILIPETRRKQYAELAHKLNIPLSQATAALASIGYDALMSGSDTVKDQRARLDTMSRSD